MKALCYDTTLGLRDVPKPRPAAGEALVKVTLAGICRTDIEITKGYMDFHGVLGHEFVGRVEEASQSSLLGRRVVGEINAACGTCALCRQGLGRHCTGRTVLGIAGRDGAFAEYLTLPEANLVPVPDRVPDEAAVFVEPLAACSEILEQVAIRPCDNVLIIGDGRLGLLVAMVLRLTGCRLVLMGKHPEKLRIVERLGVQIVSPSDHTVPGHGYDVVVEASGNPTGWDVAVGSVRPRGTIVLKSTYHGAMSFNPAVLVINEVSVVGSRCGMFAPAVRLLDTGLVDPLPLIAHEFSVERAAEAFQRAQEAGVLKVLLRFG